MDERKLGVTRACGLVGISRSLFAYESKRGSDRALTERMKALAAAKRRYGYAYPCAATPRRLASEP